MSEGPKRRRPIHFWTWSHRLTAAAFLVLLVAGHQGWFPWIKGSPTGTRFFDVLPFVDVLAAAESTLASWQVTKTMLIGTLLVVLVAVLLGRVFCGWLCPLGLVLELNDSIRTRLSRRIQKGSNPVSGFQRRADGSPGSQANRKQGLTPFGVSRELKYWLLLLCLVTSLVAAFPVFTTISPINLTILALVSTPGWELAVVGAIVAVEYFSPRVFCRSICPLGAAYSLLGRLGLLRILIKPECGEKLYCQLCTKECPMGIDVLELHVEAGKRSVDDPECTRCGTCADGCLGAMLHMGLRGVGWSDPAERSGQSLQSLTMPENPDD